jgi:hypothetical protein
MSEIHRADNDENKDPQESQQKSRPKRKLNIIQNLFADDIVFMMKWT